MVRPSTSGMVSVVVPCFNKAPHVAGTLDSALVQEDVPLEVIVIDDASTDGSWDVVSEYRRRVVARRLPRNRGAPFARNLGARMAGGDFLMFLDADDVLASDTLAGLRAAIRGRPGCIGVCDWLQLRKEDGEWVVHDHRKPLGPDEEGDYVRPWLRNLYYPPCAVLWRREVFEASGGWDEQLSAWQDTDLMLRVLVRGRQLVPAERGLSYYRVDHTGSSVSSRPGRESAASRVRVLDKLVEEAARADRLEPYRHAIGRAYFELAHSYAAPHRDLKLECLRKADDQLGRKPLSGSWPHRLLWRTLGLERKERLAMWLAGHGVLRRSSS